jgi:hypothetical protein
MNGLDFEDKAPVVAVDPNRADIAFFAGFVERRDTAVPSEIERWLDQRGWPAPSGTDQLLDVPVPIDNWEVFDRLFAWERRGLDGRGAAGTTYLGAAVRSFFAQGGRKCYVVRAGDPWLFTASSSDRRDRLPELIPGYPQPLASSPVDRKSWSGVGHMFGLPDVSFVCLPDLADVVAADREPVELPVYIIDAEEQFVECSQVEPRPPEDGLARLFRAPRCDEAGYQAWATALKIVADAISRHQREVQLVAAVPIPVDGTQAERDLMEFLSDRNNNLLATRLLGTPRGLASSFVQLVYPWARTPGSANLPEQLESPDAIVAGILARNALMRGGYFSAAGLHLADVFDLQPSLRRFQMMQAHADDSDARRSTVRHTLLERVSLLVHTPRGIELGSDVTTSLDESYRPASINRLVSILVRAARRLGEDVAFESSGEQLWAKLRESLTTLLLGLWQEGAFRGPTPADAFYVRCDRSTMTQNDIDNGRVIALVQFDAAFPIERITVVLAMDEGGQVSLLAAEAANREAA